jgi:nucleotide-binding universal stress UspA family protein
MGKLYSKMLVTAEKAGTFHAACDLAAFISEKFPPETVDFLFIHEDLSSIGPELGNELKKFQERTKHLSVATDQSFREGNFQRGTLEMASHFGAEIIICGADNKTRRFWNGSQTYQLLKEAHCPVISIQSPMRRQAISKIVVPIDSSFETRQKLSAAKRAYWAARKAAHA